MLSSGNWCFGISFYPRQTFQGDAADTVFSLWFWSACCLFILSDMRKNSNKGLIFMAWEDTPGIPKGRTEEEI